MLLRPILLCFRVYETFPHRVSYIIADPRGRPLNILKKRILATTHPGYAMGIAPTQSDFKRTWLQIKACNLECLPLWFFSSAFMFEICLLSCVDFLSTPGLFSSLSSDTGLWGLCSFARRGGWFSVRDAALLATPGCFRVRPTASGSRQIQPSPSVGESLVSCFPGMATDWLNLEWVWGFFVFQEIIIKAHGMLPGDNSSTKLKADCEAGGMTTWAQGAVWLWPRPWSPTETRFPHLSSEAWLNVLRGLIPHPPTLCKKQSTSSASSYLCQAAIAERYSATCSAGWPGHATNPLGSSSINRRSYGRLSRVDWLWPLPRVAWSLQRENTTSMTIYYLY